MGIGRHMSGESGCSPVKLMIPAADGPEGKDFDVITLLTMLSIDVTDVMLPARSSQFFSIVLSLPSGPTANSTVLKPRSNVTFFLISCRIFPRSAVPSSPIAFQLKSSICSLGCSLTSLVIGGICSSLKEFLTIAKEKSCSQSRSFSHSVSIKSWSTPIELLNSVKWRRPVSRGNTAIASLVKAIPDSLSMFREGSFSKYTASCVQRPFFSKSSAVGARTP
mmetsp:Transcript_37222/g.68671  ORF Transcript_37222/g.68671 Transcript_37222/m.68671 type:complete len:221 (-) Transcript_37222:119-781(-)